MSKNTESESSEQFYAWKAWIEEKAAWVLSYALDEKYAKELVTSISNYVVDYMYPSDNPAEAAQNQERVLEQLERSGNKLSPEVRDHENFRDLIEALQTPPQGQLLLTNFPANPEKHIITNDQIQSRDAEIPQQPLLLTDFPANPEKYAEKENAASISSEALKYRDIKPLPMSNAKRFKGLPVSSEQIYESINNVTELKRKAIHQISDSLLEKAIQEAEQREARLVEYRQSQAKGFTPFSSLSDELRAQLMAEEKEKIEHWKNLERQQQEPTSYTIPAPDLPLEGHYSHNSHSSQAITYTNNPLKSRSSSSPQASKIAAKKVEEIREEREKANVSVPLPVQASSTHEQRSKAPSPKQPSVAEDILKHQDAFRFLPSSATKKDQDKPQKEISKWEKQRLEKLARQANLSSSSASVVYQGDASNDLTSSLSVRERAKAFTRNKTRGQ